MNDKKIKDCECVNWCRDGRDMISQHHHHCEHYKSTLEDQRYAKFGKAMWEMITELGDDFCGDAWSEDVLPLAMEAGLCKRVEYNPEIHGEIYADPGELIWYWGESSDKTTKKELVYPGDRLLISIAFLDPDEFGEEEACDPEIVFNG